MLLAVLFYLLPIFAIGRGVLGIALILSLFGISLARVIHWKISDHDLIKRRIIVLGAGKQASLMERLRRKSDQYGFKIVGYVHMHGEIDVVDNYKILPSIKSLKTAVEEYEVDEIVVALDDRRKNFPVDEILDCKMEGITISEISKFFEDQTEKIRLDTLHPSSMIFSSGFDRAIHSSYRKRTFDVLSALMMLLLTWPVMLFISLAIYMESGFSGPIFYRQERVGKDGKNFNVLKFRSMRTDAEKDGKAQWAQKNDDRVTRVGRIIRLTRIDELPQLINVLKGEMSFVGPRPERPQFVEQLSQSIPFYNLRHKVNPGITGWAQISYPYGSSHQDAIEKLQYDLYYIKHYSVIFDMMILFQTAQAVLWSKGAR
jgi:sugar transferase (PEP-CTERM system associated)